MPQLRFILNITGRNRFEHITPHLQSLHFLPIQFRLKFKICLKAYRCINNFSPKYLIELINTRNPIKDRALRKDIDNLLLVEKTPEKQNYKNRSFSHTAPLFWNKLPLSIRQSPSALAFKTNLKTYFFSQWVNGEE